jgi:hypothetical protein
MTPVADLTPETALDSPLSSASLRYSVRVAPAADGPGSPETRPLGPSTRVRVTSRKVAPWFVGVHEAG